MTTKKGAGHERSDRADDPDEKTATPELGGSRPERAPARSTPDERRHHGPQPGGGKHSESEKPSSPDSRWGGGRRP